MNREEAYPKGELLKRLHRYCWDDNRLFPIYLFARECGVTPHYFRQVFRYQTHEVSVPLQISASRVLKAWEEGRIKILTNGGRKHKVVYRDDDPKPRLKPVCQLIFKPDGIALTIGTVNRSDYSDREGLFHAPARLPLPRTRTV